MKRFRLLGAPLLATAALAQPPVFHWPLDESNGTVAHAWGGADGLLVGGMLWDPSGGHHQGAARFDGVDDRILLGPCDITSGNAGFTVSLWAKPDFVTGMERTLIAKATGPQLSDHVWSIAFVNGSALRFRLRSGGTSSELITPPSSLFGGNWYHIIGTYDGTQMRLYVNAGLMGAQPKGGLIGLHPQAPASLGALSTGAQPYSGWIDDVRIYDRALTDQEIIGLLFETLTTGILDEVAITGSISDLLSNASVHARITVHDALGREVYSTAATGNPMSRIDERFHGLLLVRLQDGETSRTVRAILP